jgi:hypothetical protein
MANRASADKRAVEHRARGAAREADVAATLTKLKGSSRNDVASDADRGGASPLGHGQIAEREEKRKGK